MLAIGIVLCVILSSAFATENTMEFTGASSSWIVKYNGGIQQNNPLIEVCSVHSLKITKTFSNTYHPLKIVEGDETWTAAVVKNAITGGNIGTGTGEVTLGPTADKTYTYICTAHSGMIGKIKFDVSYCPAPTAAKCNTHTCPSGHVLKETPENIPCAGTTCASPADDDTCCEPGYSFGLADINLCPDDSPVNIVWAGEHNIQESVSHDCLSAEISGPLEFDGSHTHTSGDEQFLYAGTRKDIAANLLSDWKSGCTAATPCKILALHGGGGSANSMQTQMTSLAASLGNAFTFVYASISNDPNTAETWWADPHNKETPTTSEDHASAMVAALDTIRINQGPFWGIVGYSQGAAAVPVYLSNVPDGTFQAAAMFAGYLTDTHRGLLDKVNSEAPFGHIPALIWSSPADTSFYALSSGLNSKFTTPTLIEDASAGHVVPKTGHPTFTTVADWFRDTAAATPPPRVRYFRCAQHCGGARLRVTCNRAKPLGYCAADYAALGRVYDPDVPECPHGASAIVDGDTSASSKNSDTKMCRCGKCGEIFESMVIVGEACDDGVRRANPATSGSCDTFACPALFSSKSSASSIDCAAEVCTQQSDLYTCCESTDELYGRSDNGENDCNDDNCDGNGNKCVDANGKVTTKCKCLKDPYFKDFRHVIAEVGDYCDEEGFFDEAEDSEYGPNETRDREEFGFQEGCDKRCQKVFETTTWNNFHKLLDRYESRPCRADGLTGPKCSSPGRRRLQTEVPLLQSSGPHTHRSGVHVACHADQDLGMKQKKGFDCFGCKKCQDEIDSHDYGPIKVVPNADPNKAPNHGSCRAWCVDGIEGTLESFYNNRFCGGLDKDGVFRPRGSKADRNQGCFSDDPTSGEPSRKNYVCSHWRRCTGCKVCIDAAADPAHFPKGFGPAKPKDIYGDGSRIAGECRFYCKSHFYYENSGPSKSYYDRWNDGSDNGAIGSKCAEARAGEGEFLETTGDCVNKHTAPKDICTWKGCSGCRGCIEWATADDNAIVPGTTETYGTRYGTNDGFRFKEPMDEFSGKTHSRKTKNRIGGCQTTCKAKFEAEGANARDICTTDECDGCEPCQNPTKYITKFAGQTSKLSIYNKFKRDTGDMIIDDREKYGQEDDGFGGKQVIAIRGNTESNTWARTSTCPGFPKCFAFQGVCETAHCGRCDECKGKTQTERDHYSAAIPIYRN